MSSDSLKLTVGKPARIRSWKALVDECANLARDLDNYGYKATFGSDRRYCANVKVHSWVDLDKAIAKLGDIPIEAKEDLQEYFDESHVYEVYNDWIEESGKYLTQWFKGASHSGPAYWAEQIAKQEAGEELWQFKDTPDMPQATRIRKLKQWAAEEALFLEAFRAADDGDTIEWCGRSGGYITWDPRGGGSQDGINDLLWRIEMVVDERQKDSFRDLLSEFREMEREHLLNVALIEYLRAWAKRMDGQEALDYEVSSYYSEIKGDYVGGDIYKLNADLVVTIADSLAAGNCESGTICWIEDHIPGRTSATVGELLAIDNDPLVRRACRKAIHRKAS